MRLNPLGPSIYVAQVSIACAHFFAGRYNEAFVMGKAVLQENRPITAHCASLRQAVRLPDGVKMRREPWHVSARSILNLRVSDLTDLTPVRRREHFAKYVIGSRTAELPVPQGETSRTPPGAFDQGKLALAPHALRLTFPFTLLGLADEMVVWWIAEW